MPAFVTVKVTFTVKLVVLVAVPPGVVTRSGPVVAPVGTVARIAVSEVTVKLALAPLNVTAVAPVKAVPLIVTVVPTCPLGGVKRVVVRRVGGDGRARGAADLSAEDLNLGGPRGAALGTRGAVD